MLEFYESIEFIKGEVDKNLKKIPIPEKPKYLYGPIHYALRASGKRFRPILVHLVGKSLKVNPDSLMKMSLAVELLHIFTLVHDDIMDNDTMRHGMETIHEKWDASTAILAGDGIYTIAQIILNEISGSGTELSKYFNKVTLEICEGQALDKEFENKNTITENMYMEMIEKKTGVLLGASAALPSIYSNDEVEQIRTFESFGKSLGKGFQIHDDILEITGNQKVMGKSLGSDILEGKQTIMVIKAKSKFPNQWKKMLKNSNQGNLVGNASKFFKENGIIEMSKKIANNFFKSSIDDLKRLQGIKTSELERIVELIQKRTY